jgi:hypothetical protein
VALVFCVAAVTVGLPAATIARTHPIHALREDG